MKDGTLSLGHVLLIDDEEVDRRIYARVLKRAGLVTELTAFGYAADALAYLRDPDRPPVDLILLDVNMPGMSGFEFLTRMERMSDEIMPPPPVIVMLTTSLNPTDMARAQAFASVRAYLNKPLDIAQINDLIPNLRSTSVDTGD